MAAFIGDYNCKIDSKSRIMLSSALMRQMPHDAQNKFVVKKDIYENCLILYPINEWERQNKIIRENTNPYNKEHNNFIRRFYKGTAEVILDSNNRLLLPKRLLELVGIENEVVLAGQDGKIEIWAKSNYEKIDKGEDDFPLLAEKIMGSIKQEKD